MEYFQILLISQQLINKKAFFKLILVDIMLVLPDANRFEILRGHQERLFRLRRPRRRGRFTSVLLRRGQIHRGRFPGSMGQSPPATVVAASPGGETGVKTGAADPVVAAGTGPITALMARPMAGPTSGS